MVFDPTEVPLDLPKTREAPSALLEFKTVAIEALGYDVPSILKTDESA